MDMQTNTKQTITPPAFVSSVNAALLAIVAARTSRDMNPCEGTFIGYRNAQADLREALAEQTFRPHLSAARGDDSHFHLKAHLYSVATYYGAYVKLKRPRLEWCSLSNGALWVWDIERKDLNISETVDERSLTSFVL